ncbi:MAG: hypothetical protein KatS3mg031_0839 [Chitinophagales bacterium]|nr:MAG: hypothetical protein KatS3mg031_0839 [Chitinophagales bacterium]
MKYNFIAIEGNIGSGKTSLACMLAEEYNAQLCLEKFEDNPFLPRFYSNPRRYAFPLELFFMAERFQQMSKLQAGRDLFKDLLISDYCFAKSLLFAGINLGGDEYVLYRKLFDIIQRNLPRPELIIYLHNDVANLMIQIAKRGRPYERQIQEAYLEKIQLAYFQYFRSISWAAVLIVHVAQLNFTENKEHYRRIKDLLKHDYTPGIHYINP